MPGATGRKVCAVLGRTGVLIICMFEFVPELAILARLTMALAPGGWAAEFALD